jgi:hypothetical protein
MNTAAAAPARMSINRAFNSPLEMRTREATVLASYCKMIPSKERGRAAPIN